ncbi:hypothetical protein ACHHYP_20877, partial [Achlya hypogyna]
MVDYIKHHESDWLVSFEQKYGPRTTLNLMHLCRRFAARHGFVRKCATTSKMSADDLMRQVRQNAQAFWEKHSGKDASLVLNCDETGICNDMPPRKILTMKSYETVERTLKSELYALPPNTTSPLAVGVMGPYKAKLRALWLRDTNKYSTPAAKRLAVIKRAIA